MSSTHWRMHHNRAKLIIAAVSLFLGILALIGAANHKDGRNARYYAVEPADQHVQTTATAAKASICRAHHAISMLLLATAVGWPTLNEFVAVDVSRTPFAMEVRDRHDEDRGGGDAVLLERQNTAVLRGWTETYENLLHGRRRAAAPGQS
ncbi:hypothetical protein CGRA01v4_15040 [Colletotrichum graminicola]|nr:hypothetical protein CGRA01v4_15040 [Colletotrichum graminicola]